MIITIVNVSSPESKGTWQSLEVIYKDEMGRTNNRNIVSFGKTAKTFVDIQEYANGDVVEVTTEQTTGKDGKPYNNWIAVGAVGTVPKSSAPAAKSSPTATAAPKAAGGGGNWETPEERAKRQVFIIRQSSLSTAVATLAIGGKPTPTGKAVIALAKEYEAYVFGLDTDVANFDDFDDDIPL